MEIVSSSTPPPKRFTYWGQVFDNMGLAIGLAVVLIVFLIIGIYSKDEGRWMLWGSDLVILAAFFLIPLVNKEQRDQREISEAADEAWLEDARKEHATLTGTTTFNPQANTPAVTDPPTSTTTDGPTH